MAQNVIAIVSDCDGTICPDTATALVQDLGLDADKFWLDVGRDVEDGWDPPLTWLSRLIRASREGAIPPLTRERLRLVGVAVPMYPGVADFLDRIRERIHGRADFREAGIIVEWYIVSSGIEEMLRALNAARMAKDVFGSRLHYDAPGRAIGVKASVTFTEKTKFIFAINKGISSEELYRTPYRVNDAVDAANRRVPFNHMVYVGDGPSDIPCFSMVKAYSGDAIGVIPPEDTELRKPYELAQGQRLTVGPYSTNYQSTSDLFRMLMRVVEGIGDRIVVERAQQVRSGPRY